MTGYTFPLARYEFNIRVTRAFEQQDYAGSMLRGLFGHALKNICCVTRQSQCRQCERYRQCLYTTIFETPPPEEGHRLQNFSQIPSPYVIEPPKWGKRTYKKNDIFSFNMILTGQALHNLPLVIFTWQEALKQGIAKQKGSGIVESVYLCQTSDNKQCIFNEAQEELLEHDPLLALPEFKLVDKLALNFISPLRIQKQGKILNETNLSVKALLIPLAKRLSLVNEFHNNIQLLDNFRDVSQWTEQVSMIEELSWLDWSRYSNRQHQKMKLGGLIGTITLAGNLSPFYPLLYLGQWLHIGKNTSFGLGRYELEFIS